MKAKKRSVEIWSSIMEDEWGTFGVFLGEERRGEGEGVGERDEIREDELELRI